MTTGDSHRLAPSTRYFTTGTWAVVDQALFAGSNFAVSILVARWLSPSEYGVFVIALSLFYFVGSLHGALLTEPMIVYGPGRYRTQLLAYFEVILSGHFLLSIGGAAILSVIALGLWIAGNAEVAAGVGAAAASVPFLLLVWTARRACYVTLNPRLSSSGGFIYLTSTVLGLWVLNRFGFVSVRSAFALMSGSALLASVWLLFRLGVRRMSVRIDTMFTTALREHWSYGRWSAPTALLQFIPANIYLFVLPIWGGLASTGALKALLNLLLPILHLITAGSQLAVPVVVSLRDSVSRIRRFLWAGLALILAGGLFNYVVVGLYAEPVLEFLYGGQYTQYSNLLWVLGLLPISAGLVALAGSVLRGLERPDRIFVSYLGSTAVSVSLGVALVAVWKLQGAAVATVVTSATTAFGLAIMLVGVLRERRVPTP